MSEAMTILLDLVIIIAVVFANGFFVAAEFALVKIRTSQLRPMAATGGWRVRFAIAATENLGGVLSATQLGITLTSLALGWLGEPVISHHLAPVMRAIGITDQAAVTSMSVVVGFSIITFVHIVIGELSPKALAIQRPKAVALNAAAPLMIFYRVFYPFIWLLNVSANRCLRWLGLEAAGNNEHAFSAEELEYVFSQARHSHPGDALINRLMVRSVRLRSVTAQQIMRAREQVVALWTDRPMAENLRTAQTSGFSRYPVCGGSLDEVKGILLVREWLWQIQALGNDASFEPLIRPALTFTLRTPIHSMLELFRTSRSHLAIVIDADEKLAGIVTFEDVLEEIVGDIRDEFDLGRGPVFEHTESSIVVSGLFSMRELQAETGWAFELQPRETVAAWAERLRGSALKRGETFVSGDYRITATDVSAERLRRVKVERV
jgi:CBS domain containing-hemolysin-like protein